jgi:hypothetical protein
MYRVISSLIYLVILHTKYTGRRLSDFNVHG